ncbi:unnamed protein product [Rotaria magnacalcarata]
MDMLFRSLSDADNALPNEGYDKALSEADKALRNEDYNRAHTLYGNILTVYEDDDINSYLKSVILASMAKCSNKLRYYDRAIMEATSALDKDSTCVIALKQRAESHYKLNHYEQAKIDINDALALAPSDIELLELSDRFKTEDLNRFGTYIFDVINEHRHQLKKCNQHIYTQVKQLDAKINYRFLQVTIRSYGNIAPDHTENRSLYNFTSDLTLTSTYE